MSIMKAWWLNIVGAHVDGTDISSAAVLTRPTGARKVMIQALDQNIRFTLDGTTPTATLGFQVKAGDPPITIPVGDADDDETVVTVIEEAATADIQYQWGT